MKKSVILFKRRALLAVLFMALTLLSACLWEVIAAIPIVYKVAYCFAYLGIKSFSMFFEE